MIRPRSRFTGHLMTERNGKNNTGTRRNFIPPVEILFSIKRVWG